MMPVGLSDGTSYKDNEEWAAVAITGKQRSDIAEINANTTSGDFQSRFYATDQSTMPPGASTELAGALKRSTGIQVPDKTPGLIKPGNIDINNPPIAKNEDGSISTVRSMSIGTDQGEVLIPTVHPDAYIMSNEEAVKHYEMTGKHLGIFQNPEAATAYGEQLHQYHQEKFVPKVLFKTKAGDITDRDVETGISVALGVSPLAVKGTGPTRIPITESKSSYLPPHISEDPAAAITDMGNFHHAKMESGQFRGEETWAGQGWQLTKPAAQDAESWYLVEGNKPGKFIDKEKASNFLLSKDKPDANKVIAEIDKALGNSGEFKQYEQKPFDWGEYYDNYVKESTKLSPKESFLQGVEETHAQLVTTLANIKNKYLNTVKDNPNLDEVKAPVNPLAAERGYTEPAYRGVIARGEHKISPYHNYGEAQFLYSSQSPMLADMYSSYLTKHPGYHVPEGVFEEGAQVMPLYINPKTYHYYDAQGGHWSTENPKAIKEALQAKKEGVIVDNVWDEPNSTHNLTPKKLFITFPQGAHTVKSRFAERFDASSANILESIAAIGMVGGAGSLAIQDYSE